MTTLALHVRRDGKNAEELKVISILRESLSGASAHSANVLTSPEPFRTAEERVKNDGDTQASACPRAALEVGTQAPDFTLQATPDQTVSLKDLRGAPVILAFYPADWSPVCGDQMALYNELLSEFERFNASLVGISVDGIWCHLAFSKDRKLHFPLLADFEPKGAVARNYEAYRQQDGICERALFVIDAEGTIRWSHVSPIGINPGANGILAALEAMTSKQEITA